MQAFTLQQLQVTLTVATWMGHNGIDFPTIVAYLKMIPYMQELNNVGYFIGHGTVEHAKKIREFERSLPKNLRRGLRKARLQRIKEGPVHR